MAMPRHLPFDIWQHIALFIPHETLRTLFTVNSALFDISMEARYRAMSFGPEDGDISKHFIKLQYVPSARKVTR